MRLVDKEKFEIGVRKTQKWYWKPKWSGANSNFVRVQNGRDFKYINTWSYFILTTIQLFFLGWVVYINIKPKLIGGELPIRYVKFENTHLNLMDIPQGSWYDDNES